MKQEGRSEGSAILPVPQTKEVARQFYDYLTAAFERNVRFGKGLPREMRTFSLSPNPGGLPNGNTIELFTS